MPAKASDGRLRERCEGTRSLRKARRTEHRAMSGLRRAWTAASVELAAVPWRSSTTTLGMRCAPSMCTGSSKQSSRTCLFHLEHRYCCTLCTRWARRMQLCMALFSVRATATLTLSRRRRNSLSRWASHRRKWTPSCQASPIACSIRSS